MEAVLIGIALALVAIILVLWVINAAIWLVIGALHVWQVSLVLILFGGFVGGPIGAILGILISGCVGLLDIKVFKTSEEHTDHSN